MTTTTLRTEKFLMDNNLISSSSTSSTHTSVSRTIVNNLIATDIDEQISVASDNNGSSDEINFNTNNSLVSGNSDLLDFGFSDIKQPPPSSSNDDHNQITSNDVLNTANHIDDQSLIGDDALDHVATDRPAAGTTNDCCPNDDVQTLENGVNSVVHEHDHTTSHEDNNSAFHDDVTENSNADLSTSQSDTTQSMSQDDVTHQPIENDTSNGESAAVALTTNETARVVKTDGRNKGGKGGIPRSDASKSSLPQQKNSPGPPSKQSPKDAAPKTTQHESVAKLENKVSSDKEKSVSSSATTATNGDGQWRQQTLVGKKPSRIPSAQESPKKQKPVTGKL